MKDACVLSAVISVHNEVTDLCGCFFKYEHFSLSQELIFIKSEGYIKTVMQSFIFTTFQIPFMY